MTDSARPVERERGWRKLLLALFVFVLLPIAPPLPAVTPLVETVLLLVPALAVCALAGWWRGGRLSFAVMWLVLTAWLVWPRGADVSAYGLLARGWALLLAGAFGLVVLTDAPGSGRVFTRSLRAVAMAGAVALTAVLVTPSGARRVAATMGEQFEARVSPLREYWHLAPGSDPYRTVSGQPSAWSAAFAATYRWWQPTVNAMPSFATRTYPALLALESVAALALAWALYHRLARARVGPPLAPLIEFRFADQMVWGVLAGTVMLMLPLAAGWRTLGLNLLVFFGALFLLRGLGVLLWFAAAARARAQGVVRRAGVLWLAGAAIIFFPVTGSLAFALGLGDTWADWRGMSARPTT